MNSWHQGAAVGSDVGVGGWTACTVKNLLRVRKAKCLESFGVFFDVKKCFDVRLEVYEKNGCLSKHDKSCARHPTKLEL
jgi:hypothetical protein